MKRKPKINVRFYVQYPERDISLIMLSISWDGRRLLLSSGLSVEPNRWEHKRQRVKSSSEFSLEHNRYLETIEDKIRGFYFKRKAQLADITKLDMKSEINSLRKIKNRIGDSNSTDTFLLDYFRDFIDERSKSNNFTFKTIQNYRNAYNHLVKYQIKRGRTLGLEHLNSDLYKDFINYLIDDIALTRNTVATINKVFKTFINYLISKKLIDNIDHKSELRSRMSETDVISLNVDEYIKLVNTDFESLDLRKTKVLFVFQCETGLRIGDLRHLKPENFFIDEALIKFTTMKTKDKLVIPISNRLLEILKNYPDLRLPVYKDSKEYNKNIKEICRLAGICTMTESVKFIGSKRVEKLFPKYEMITSHSARRTFIIRMLRKGILPEELKKITGHKNVATLYKYVKIANDEAVENIRQKLNED